MEKSLKEKFVPIISIDGPSGSGKSSLAKAIAKRLNWNLLDSGAIYRVCAYLLLRNKIPIPNCKEVVKLIRGAKFQIRVTSSNEILIRFQGKYQNSFELSQEIRTEEVSRVASLIAADSEIREILIESQRSFARFPGLVAEGRDMGTVIFPEAILKIYLTADLSARSKRRFFQVKKPENPEKVDQDSIEKEIRARDQRDCLREFAPLKRAKDAIIIDNSKMSLKLVLEKVYELAILNLSQRP